MTMTLLEQRRREARAHDGIQRQAEEMATRSRSTPAARRELQAPVQPEPPSESDLLAALLVRDGRQLATTADLQAVVSYFQQQLEDLRQS